MSTKLVFYQPYKSTLQEINSGLRVEKNVEGISIHKRKFNSAGRFFKVEG